MFDLVPLTLLECFDQATTIKDASDIFFDALADNGLGDGVHVPSYPRTGLNPLKDDTVDFRCLGSVASQSLNYDLCDLIRTMPVDPMAAYLRNKLRPLVRRYDPNCSDSYARKTAEIALGHGIGSRVYFPLHGGDGRIGTLGLHVSRWEADLDDALEKHLTEVHLAAYYFRGFCDTRFGAMAISIDLAPRERECLLWVATGLSSKRIAYKLGISFHTVNEFIGNAMRKLDAKTRAEAAAKAIAAKQIRP